MPIRIRIGIKMMPILSQVLSMLKIRIFKTYIHSSAQFTLNFPSRHQLIKLLSNSTFQYEVSHRCIATSTWVPVYQSCSNLALYRGYRNIHEKKDQDPDIKTKKTLIPESKLNELIFR